MAEKKSRISEALEKYVPAIFIGIGGTGTNVVSAVREKVVHKVRRERAEDWRDIVDNVFQFIVIDTTSKGAEALGIPADNYFNIAGFDGTETVNVYERRDPYFKKWWYPGYRSRYLDAGAGAIRINGRLCLLQNLSGTPNIAGAITYACNRVANIFATNIAGGSENIPMNVYIFSSICGGTGSGMFIDLAFYLREHLHQNFRPNMYAYLFTPEVISLVAPAGDQWKWKANAYATLRELDFWQNPKRGLGYEWKIGSEEIRHPESTRLFTLVHFIHRCNDSGNVIPDNDYTTVRRLAADIMFYDAVLPASSHRQGGARFNITTKYDDASLYDKQYPITYGSAAVATLKCPLEKITRYIGLDMLGLITRERLMKEPEEAAKKEFEDFINDKAGISLEHLRNNIVNDPNYTRLPSRYKAGLRKSKRSTIGKAYEDALRDLKRFKNAAEVFFRGTNEQKGKREEIETAFKKALDTELRYLLNLTNRDKLGLTAQVMEILKNFLIGQVEKKEYQPGLTLLDEVNRLKSKVKDLETRRDEVYAEVLNASLFRFGSAKEDLIEVIRQLYEATQDLLIYDVVYSIYRSMLQQVSMTRAAIKFVKEEIVHNYLSSREGEKANVWRRPMYDDERGGLVFEVLDERWAKQELQKIKDSKDYKTMADDLFSTISAKCSEEIMKTYEELKGGKALDAIREERKTGLQKEFYTLFLQKADGILRERYENLDIWQALVTEMRADTSNEEEINRGITERITEFASKISPWWPVKDNDLRSRGIYNARMVAKMGIILCNQEAYTKFVGKYKIDLAQILGTRQEHLNLVDTDDSHSIQVVFFKYGAPLYLFKPVGDYIKEYESYKKTSDTPLYTDQRYERDRNYKLPKLLEELEEVDRLYKQKVTFVLAECITIPGEGGPRIRMPEKKNQYTFVLPPKHGIPDISPRGRKLAQEHLFEDNFKDNQKRYAPIYNDLKNYWNELPAKEQRQKLEECLNYLGEWIKIAGKPAETGARERELMTVLQEDLAAVQAKLDSGDYEI